MNFSLKRHLPIIIAAFLFIITTWFFWPGMLSEDAAGQMQQAFAGFYTDHHPPMMAFYWRLLMKLVPGPGLLFLTQQLFLWLAVGIFAYIFEYSPWRWFFLALPFWPQIFRYEFFLLKDVQFTYCFLLIAALLSYYAVRQRRPGWLATSAILLLAFYGTAIKFQAQFVLPLITLWLSCVLYRSKEEESKTNIARPLVLGLFLSGGLLFGVHSFNDAMTNVKNHMWQSVKIYDLAAMSLQENRSLFPDFINQNPLFSMEAVAARYNIERVDDLFYDDISKGDAPGPLRAGNNEEERNALYAAWLKAVVTNPLGYIRARAVLSNRLTSSPLGRSCGAIAADPTASPLLRKLMHVIDQTGVEQLLRLILSFKFYLALMFLYIALALAFPFSRHALSLLFLNALGLAIIGVIFFCSMATAPRYIYLATCCHHFSHPFFFSLIRDLWLKKLARATEAVVTRTS